MALLVTASGRRRNTWDNIAKWESLIRDRHFEWGDHCPAVDIDWLAVEYGGAKPAAIVDYKHHDYENGDSEFSLRNTSYQALKHLAGEKVGVYVVKYDERGWRFRVYPLNNAAAAAVGAPIAEVYSSDYGVRMSEPEYVDFLYHMRGRPGGAPESVRKLWQP